MNTTNPNPNPKKGKKSKSSRLQKRAPKPIQVTPSASASSRRAEDWKVAIPLLTPLILSPTEEDPTLEVEADGGESDVDHQIEATQTWQHPAAPFFYESGPLVTPFLNQCRS